MRRELYLLAAALLFVSGNLTAGYILSCTTGSIRTAAALIFLTCIADIALIFLIKRRIPWIVLTAFPFIGASGAAAHEFFRPGPGTSSLNGSRSMTVEGIISDGGLSSSGRPFLEVELEGESTIIYNIPPEVQWMPGDTVMVSGVGCSRVENFTPDFDYRRWMERQGVFYTCFFRDNSRIEIRPRTSTPPLRFVPARMRKNFSSAVDRAMPSEEMAGTRAVVKALAYGYQDEIPSETEETFRQSGAIHLLALSGMHLGLLYGMLTHLLGFAGNSPAVRRARSVLIILVLWAFTIFTGCGVSILRAAVMFSIYEAGAIGRARSGVDSMALSAIIITVADPDAPSGLSFQLSYAAMTAIFLIYPHLKALVPTRGKAVGSIVDVCAMTVACQITTAPIIYLHFGTFAFFSLLANLLCTPLVSIAMALIPAAMTASCLGDGAAAATAGILSAVIKIFIDINAVISHL